MQMMVWHGCKKAFARLCGLQCPETGKDNNSEDFRPAFVRRKPHCTGRTPAAVLYMALKRNAR